MPPHNDEIAEASINLRLKTSRLLRQCEKTVVAMLGAKFKPHSQADLWPSKIYLLVLDAVRLPRHLGFHKG